jgi:thioesterase domain-containing protein
MLVPVQTSGDNPPLFFVHGPLGIMPLGASFAAMLGPEQPFFALHASGIDGRRPAIDDAREMVPVYVEEIEEARAAGPIVVGGIRDGGLAAIEIARALLEKGRQVGPVILADPPAAPGQSKRPAPTGFEPQLRQRVQQNLLAYASRPDGGMPFDPRDPQQMQRAVAACVGSLVAFARHVPGPFAGPAQLILSAQAAVGFFHPQVPWHKLLTGPRMVHVLPAEFTELFQAARPQVARALRFLLGEAPTLEQISERHALDAPAIEHYARNIDTLVAKNMK